MTSRHSYPPFEPVGQARSPFGHLAASPSRVMRVALRERRARAEAGRWQRPSLLETYGEEHSQEEVPSEWRERRPPEEVQV